MYLFISKKLIKLIARYHFSKKKKKKNYQTPFHSKNKTFNHHYPEKRSTDSTINVLFHVFHWLLPHNIEVSIHVLRTSVLLPFLLVEGR